MDYINNISKSYSVNHPTSRDASVEMRQNGANNVVSANEVRPISLGQSSVSEPPFQTTLSTENSSSTPTIVTKLESVNFESSLRQKVPCVDEHECKSVDRNQEIAVPGLLFCAAIIATNDNKVAAAHWMPPLDCDSDSDDGKNLSQLKQELVDQLGTEQDIDFYVFRGRKNTKADEINETFSRENLRLNTSLEEQDDSLKGKYTVSGVVIKNGDFKVYGSL